MSNSACGSLVSSRSEMLMARARKSLAGGDSSTMRVLPYHLPLVAQRGDGSRIWDVDGRQYIDLNMAYGPLILGHRPEHPVRQVIEQLEYRGSQLGFPTEISVRVAEKVKTLFPTMQLMRFANSGTEAVASAIRLARAHTQRNVLIMFEGHYHGWSDAVFNRYHRPLAELSTEGFGPAIAGTAGMNGGPHDVVVVRWNDLETFGRCLERLTDRIAACIMEPVMGNSGVIPPDPHFLSGVRALTQEHEILLIFDEVITGMRVAAGGAQEYYQVYPDITVLSKALGGGFPVAAFGASQEIMGAVASGQVFHGGVYSGNAAVMAAADATLGEILANAESIYAHLYALGNQLAEGLREILLRFRVPHVVQNVGPMLSLFLTKEEDCGLTDYRAVKGRCDFETYIEFQHRMQELGVYFHPNQFEPLFLSTAHSAEDVAIVLERIEDGVKCSLAG